MTAIRKHILRMTAAALVLLLVFVCGCGDPRQGSETLPARSAELPESDEPVPEESVSQEDPTEEPTEDSWEESSEETGPVESPEPSTYPSEPEETVEPSATAQDETEEPIRFIDGYRIRISVPSARMTFAPASDVSTIAL